MAPLRVVTNSAIKDKDSMTRQRMNTLVAFAGAWIPLGAGAGIVIGAIHGQPTGFIVAGSAAGVVLAWLTLTIATLPSDRRPSWAQLASGMMLTGSMGFAVGAAFVPDRVLTYSALAAALFLPAAIWLWSYYRSPMRSIT